MVLIVGASSGIGRETAVLFAREGARVMASARREDRLQSLRKQLEGEGLTIEISAADAGDAGEMKQLAQRTRASLGNIDILVFAAGTNTPDRSMKRLTAEIWDMMLHVNLNGAYYAT
ncbi:MAG: SDR family oxidoreductase, partial [Acidobacteriota bacterium]|nr:SDR family oxidoreductase [Acidobacteriota bacterium]